MYGYIYITRNKINDYIYVGKKKGKFTESYLGSGKYLNNAINKYGRDNFNVSVIEYCEDLISQNSKERYWIKYYKEKGYNMYNISSGGDGGDTYMYLSSADRAKRIKKVSESSYFRYLTPQQRAKVWETRRRNGNDKFTDLQKLQQSVRLKVFYSTARGLELRKLTIERNIEKGKLTRKIFEDEWYSMERYCKTCGKRMTRIYGIGVYCSRSCSVTHKHSEETKQLIRQLNLIGVCGNLGKKFTKEHKQKIGEGNKGKNLCKKWYNNGKVEIRVLGQPPGGFVLGRLLSGKPAWNKGLTKSDPRVYKYASAHIGSKHTDATKDKISKSKRRCN